MALVQCQTINHEVKDGDTDSSSIESVAEGKQTTWQMVSQYRAAVLWSAFVGLAGINWGMDVLVSLIHLLKTKHLC